MSPLQTRLYWREWAAARRADPSADRHALHVVALGSDKSSTAFSNAEFDLVLGAFRAVSRPADLDAQLRQQDQPRARALYGIQRGRSAAYVAKVVADKYGKRSLDDLTTEQLQQLAMTLTERTPARAAVRKAKTAAKKAEAAASKRAEEPF